MRWVFLLSAMAFVSVLGFSKPAEAQNIMVNLRGDWALERASGVRLPRGSCEPGATNRFALQFGRLVWSPPRNQRIPNLALTVTTPFFQLAQRGESIIDVRDRTGTTGQIRVSNDEVTHIYDNGVRITFRRCR